MTARNTVPRSRITLTYDTRQPDQPRKEKELPLRLLVMGDLTGRANKPAADQASHDTFESRKIHALNGANLDTVIGKLGITVQLEGIANHVVRGGGSFNVDLPITSMASFEPGEVVNFVPATQQLLKIRKLLLELQAQVDNNKEFRRLLRELTLPGNEPLRQALQDAYSKGQERFAQLQIPTADQLAPANQLLPGSGNEGGTPPPANPGGAPPPATPTT